MRQKSRGENRKAKNRAEVGTAVVVSTTGDGPHQAKQGVTLKASLIPAFARDGPGQRLRHYGMVQHLRERPAMKAE